MKSWFSSIDSQSSVLGDPNGLQGETFCSFLSCFAVCLCSRIGSGNDRLEGNQGNDQLWGGAGRDTFVLVGAGVDNLKVQNRNGHAFVYEGKDLMAVVNGAAGDLQVKDNFLV